MNNIKHYEFYYNLRTLPFIEQIWLFGSRSSQTHRERSDVDIALLCPSATAEDWQKVRSIIDQADTLLKIDCIRFDQLQDERLKREIEKTKIVLFKRIANTYIWYETFLDLKEAIDKLKNIIQYDKDQCFYVVEATIQIFEYTFELYWKLLKKICRTEGVEVNSPRSALQQAYSMGLIDDQQIWLEMLEDRNLTSHTYKQATANLIHSHCKTYSVVMDDTYERIKQKFGLIYDDLHS